MEISKQTPSMELAVVTTPYQDLLEAQKDLFQSQIEKLQYVVALQCKLTGVNPLSQEMAAGALSIKIGKRPRDLLNPKALKYLQSIFSIKDAISKKETREISAHFGVTLTQIRDLFAGQRTRVRKFVRLSREKADRSAACDAMHDGTASTSDPNMPAEPLPLDTIVPANVDEGPSCSKQHEILSGLEQSDRHFVDNIFNLMRKEESFSGQIKLLQWILRIENPSVQKWFLTEGGVMILATWLSQAAAEEQTSVLHVILQVLAYLPLREALPVHMSAILQSVNRLRFYRKPDISHRATILLAKWSQMLDKSQASRRSKGVKSASDEQAEMLLKQSIDEVMGHLWDPTDENSGALKLLCDNPDNNMKLGTSQPLKMLTASGEDSNKRRGVLPSQTRERRKVQMVEHPGQRQVTRSPQVAKSTPSVQSRPLSADDIQKAKMRAQFKQSKLMKAITITSSDDHQLKPESQNGCSTSSQANQAIVSPPVSKPNVRLESEEGIKVDSVVLEPPLKKLKRIEVPWRTPPELKITDTWSVATGSNSKEVEIQKNRTKRDREVIYKSTHEIPPNPREPWDLEMDYDDTLTPVIPIDQLPDNEPFETEPEPSNNGIPESSTIASTFSGYNNTNSNDGPDLELLAELMKNPELVFALTSGQGGNSEETLKLLDMIKANSLGGNGAHNEVSLPSPTPSTDLVPNGPRPDFSRNPFSREPTMANGGGYRPQETFPTTPTYVHPQNQATSFLAAPPVHVAAPPPAPVASLHTSIQSHEQWQQQMPTNPPIMHYQHQQRNYTNTQQHMTPEIMFNANNSNRAPPNVFGAIRAEPVGPPQLSYYQNNPTPNSNYNGYVQRGPAGNWGSSRNSNNLRERSEFESWSPDNSPSRQYEYTQDRNYNGPRSNNLRHGGYGQMQQQNSGYRAGNKRWREDRR